MSDPNMENHPFKKLVTSQFQNLQYCCYCRGDSMLLTFHWTPLAGWQRLCDVDTKTNSK